MKKTEVAVKEKPKRKQKKALRTHEDELDFDILQFHGYETSQMAFNAAVKMTQLAFILDKPDIKRAFHNAFEIYERDLAFKQLIQERGVQAIPTDSFYDPSWYHKTKKDLFFALDPEIQNLLIINGVNYDN